MKPVATILKVLAAILVVAGIIYVVAAYGDKIVAWAKNLLSKNCKVRLFTPSGDGEGAEDADFEC